MKLELEEKYSNWHIINTRVIMYLEDQYSRYNILDKVYKEIEPVFYGVEEVIDDVCYNGGRGW